MLEVSIPELQIAGDMAGFAMRRFADREYTAEDYGIIPWAYFDATTGVQANAPDGTTPTDHTPRLQVLAYNIAAWGGGVIKFRGMTGSVNFNSTLIHPMGVSMRMPAFNKRPVVGGVKQWRKTLRLMPLAGGSFMKDDGTLTSVALDGHCQNGYLICGNIDPSVNASDYLGAGGIPGPGVGFMDNIRADGTPTNGIRIMRAAGPYQCHGWDGDMISSAYTRVTSLYTDKTTIDVFNFYTRANGTMPLLDLRGTGDAVYVGQVECGYYDTGGGVLAAAEGVWISNCRGGDVAMLVNGIHRFTGGSGLTIRNCHIENGQINVDRGSVAIRDNHLHNGAGLPTPIIIQNSSSGNGDSGRVILSGNIVAHYVNKGGEGHTGWSATEKLDVLIGTGGGRMDILDDGTNSRFVGVSGQLDLGNITGMRYGTLVGGVETVDANIAAYGPMIQRKPFRFNKGKVDVTGVIAGNGTWNGITVTTFTPSGTQSPYQGATQTNYYRAVVMLDPIRNIGRLASSGGGSVNIAVVNGQAALPRVNAAWGSMDHEGGFLLRLYRGATDAVYSEYVDVPAHVFNYGYDDGLCFASYPWIARTPGDVDTVQAGLTGTLVYSNGNVHVINAAQGAPTSGTWLAGDEVDRVDSQVPDANGQLLRGSFCEVGGTFGTWYSMRPSVAAQLPTAVPAGKTSGATEYNAVYTNEGATAISPFILPATVAGAKRTFVVQDADGIRVTAVAGSTIRIGSVVSASGGKIESTTIGSAVVLEAINATQWVAISVNGNWDVT